MQNFDDDDAYLNKHGFLRVGEQATVLSVLSILPILPVFLLVVLKKERHTFNGNAEQAERRLNGTLIATQKSS